MTNVNWFVYIILSSDGLLYTGVTTDITRRWKEHSGLSKGNKGAKFFRGRKPKLIRFVQSQLDRSQACKEEAAIKKLSRPNKLRLIASDSNQLNEFPELKLLLGEVCDV